MSDFVFNELGIELTKSYKKNIKLLREKGIELLHEDKNICSFKADIFDIENAEITLHKVFLTFGKCYIEIKLSEKENRELLEKIQGILKKKYGEPQYTIYGINPLWKKDNLYISCGDEEINYHYFVPEIRIYFSKPFLPIMKYEVYKEYDNMLQKIAKEWQLKYHNLSLNNINGSFCCMQNDSYQYLISFTKNTFKLYSVKKEKIDDKKEKLIPGWNTKGKYKGIESLKNQINSFLAYMEDYYILLKNE